MHPSLAELLDRTDLIVRGVLGEPRSYLSDDRQDIYTDYPLIAPVVLAQREAVSIPAEILVTQLGGTTVVDGFEFTQKELGLLPLRPAMEGLFLLERMGDKYLIAGTTELSGSRMESSCRLRPERALLWICDKCRRRMPSSR